MSENAALGFSAPEKGEHPPASVGLDGVAKLNRLGVRQPDHASGMEAHADHQTFSQILICRLGGDDRSRYLVSVPP